MLFYLQIYNSHFYTELVQYFNYYLRPICFIMR